MHHRMLEAMFEPPMKLETKSRSKNETSKSKETPLKTTPQTANVSKILKTQTISNKARNSRLQQVVHAQLQSIPLFDYITKLLLAH